MTVDFNLDNPNTEQRFHAEQSKPNEVEDLHTYINKHTYIRLQTLFRTATTKKLLIHTPTRTCLLITSTAGSMPLVKKEIHELVRTSLQDQQCSSCGTYVRDFPLKIIGGATAAKMQKPM